MKIPRILQGIVLTAGLLLVPGYAAATAPSVETITIYVDQGVVGSCGTFDVTAEFSATRRITTFYDNDGTPIRQQIHVDHPGVVTNTVTGRSLETKGLRNITRNLVTGAFKSTASNVHIVVPGQGTVVLAAGLFEIDEFGNMKEVGRQDGPITPALCAALAGVN